MKNRPHRFAKKKKKILYVPSIQIYETLTFHAASGPFFYRKQKEDKLSVLKTFYVINCLRYRYICTPARAGYDVVNGTLRG